MKDYITKYLYNDSYMRKFLSDRQYKGIDKETPSFFKSDDVTILPTKKDPDLFWGRGGAITNRGEFIEASRVGDAFGGYYDFEKEKGAFKYEKLSCRNCNIYPGYSKSLGAFFVRLFMSILVY